MTSYVVYKPVPKLEGYLSFEEIKSMALTKTPYELMIDLIDCRFEFNQFIIDSCMPVYYDGYLELSGHRFRDLKKKTVFYISTT